MEKISTCAEIESGSSETLAVSSGQPIVIPDGQLQARVGQVRQGQVVPPQGVLPSRADCLPADRGLLFGGPFAGWQEIAEEKVIKFG